MVGLIRKTFLFALVLLVATCAFAQDTIVKEKKDDVEFITKLLIDVRADFQFQQPMTNTVSDGWQNGENSYGFVGKYFNLQMGGNIAKNFSYYFRQRIKANPGSITFFDNTDFLYLNYAINKNWSIRVGKDALAVGGFEYDASPVDVYIPGYYWDNFYCFQIAGSVAYHTNDGKNTLMLQVANSPYVFYGSAFKSSLLSYNLYWSGNFGHFKTLYSFNMFERDKGKFMNYIALGNMLQFDRVNFYVDLMHHTCNPKQLFKNFAVISRLDVKVADQAILFAKGGYEQNLDQDEIAHYNAEGELWDCLALPGQQYAFYGLGFEFRPKKCPDLRLHGFVANYSICNDYVPTLQPVDVKAEYNIIANVGATWRIDFVKYFRKK